MLTEDIIYGIFIGGATAVMANEFFNPSQNTRRNAYTASDLSHASSEDDFPEFVMLKSCKFLMTKEELQYQETKTLTNLINRKIDECKSQISLAKYPQRSDIAEQDLETMQSFFYSTKTSILENIKRIKHIAVSLLRKDESMMQKVVGMLELIKESLKENSRYFRDSYCLVLIHILQDLQTYLDKIKILLHRTCLNNNNFVEMTMTDPR
jgi:hypothetical protein